LNKSKISISTKSKYNYLVGKYYEIPASDCVLIGDIPNDADDVMKKYIIEINDKMLDEEIINIIKKVLKNYQFHYNEMQNLRHHIYNNYNLEQYINKLNNILEYD